MAGWLNPLPGLLEILAAFVLFHVLLGWQPEGGADWLLLAGGAAVALAKAALLLVGLWLRAGWPTELRRPRAADLGLGLATCLPVLAAFLAADLVAPLLPVPQTVARMPAASAGWHIPVAVAFSLSVGFWEELFFRGYALKRLQGLGAKPGTANMITAVLFALGHGYQGPTAAAAALGAGWILGWLVLRRGTLFAAIVTHAGVNLIVLVAPLAALLL